MLDMTRTQQFSDIIHDTILYSGLEREVVGTPIFNRLHRILQSSMVYLTFSSNKVKRFEHSIGVMHIAGKMLFYSICNAKKDTREKFFTSIQDEVLRWRETVQATEITYVLDSIQTKYANKKILDAPFPKCMLYEQFSPACLSEKQKFLYFIVFQAVRLAALLHDVGHLPYSHIMEFAIADIYKDILNMPEEKRTPKHEDFLNILSFFSDKSPDGVESGQFSIHEDIGLSLTDKIFASIINTLPRRTDESRFFLALVFFFVKQIMKTPSDERNSIFADLHLIIDGVRDADRLDYCSRA